VKGLDKNRALTQDEKDRMQAAARQRADENDHRKDPQQRDPRQGIVDGSLTRSAKIERPTIEGRQDDFKEDPVSKIIQSGQAKVAPEYREALSDYYKAVSK